MSEAPAPADMFAYGLLLENGFISEQEQAIQTFEDARGIYLESS